MRAKSPRKNSLSWPDERRLERWVQKLKRRAAKLGFQAFPQLACAALAMESSRLSPAAEAALFSQDVREILPALNEDLLDLYGRSEQVIANLFAFHNISEALAGDFDWDMHESAAWRRELHSFDYAVALGMTYRISQERRYALHLRYLISHWIAQNPPVASTGWDLGPLARRVRNWILAWDLAKPAWQDVNEFHEVFWQSLTMQCVFLARHAAQADSLVSSLHCARALLMSSRAFRNSGQEFAELGRSLFASAAGSALDCENRDELPRPVELFELAEACLEQIIFSAPADDDSGPASFELTRRVLTLLEGALAPDGTLPMLGPAARSKVDELSDLYALAAVVFNEPRWKSLAGKFGILPYLLLGEPGKRRFEELAEEPWDSGPRAIPELGLLRFGSGKRSSLLVNARPPAAGNDHQDFLSYELYVEGLRVVVDSGPYSPEGEVWSRYFPGAGAHNVLLVRGQGPRSGAADNRSFADGRWLGAAPQDPDSVLRFHHEAFNSSGVRCHRAFFIFGDSAWAVVNWLTGAGRFDVTDLIHLFPTLEVELGSDRAVARSRALSVTIFPLGFAPDSPGPVLRTWRGPGTQNQGLYSPDFGVKFPSAVVAVSSNRIHLPWIGGYVIARGTEQTLVTHEANPAEGTLSLEISGKTHRLQVS